MIKNQRTSDSFINNNFIDVKESELMATESKYKADRKHRKANNQFQKEQVEMQTFTNPY